MEVLLGGAGQQGSQQILKQPKPLRFSHCGARPESLCLMDGEGEGVGH